MLNPLNFISKFIKSSNQKELDRLQKIRETRLTLKKKIGLTKLEDSDFPKKTEELKNKIKQGSKN